jgi:hypothetical protein
MEIDPKIAALQTEIKSESDLAAICRERRAICAPHECDQGAVCWVRDGAPSFGPAGPHGRCLGCRGKTWPGGPTMWPVHLRLRLR